MSLYLFWDKLTNIKAQIICICICKMRQMWNLLWWGKSQHTMNNEQLNLREVEKLLRGKENKGELFSVHPSFNSWLWPKTHWFYTQLISQPSLLKQSTLHMSLQPKQSRPSSSTRTALWMWKLQKTRRRWKQSLFGFGHPKQHVCPSSSGQWIGLQNILTHRNLLNFLTFKVDKPHGELKGGAPAQSVKI